MNPEEKHTSGTSSVMERRRFIQTLSQGTLGAMAFGAIGQNQVFGQTSPSANVVGANDRIRVGVMGLGRGMAHVRGAIANKNVEVAYVCDIDTNRIASAVKDTEKRQGKEPVGVQDFRRILEDKNVDVLMVATPNHWHAPATILGCSAGKHVYVEKPGSHNPWESLKMVEASRKYNRHVQMGNQRRTWPAIIEAIEKLKAGVIGPVRSARCWYDNARGSIGYGKPAAVPENLDYSLWQGVAPERAFKDNLIHYNWHWHWHWGNGELGNNGIHALDLARWGMEVDYPKQVTYNGGRYHYKDDQETPDTGLATYDFGDQLVHWDGSSCLPRKDEAHDFVRFYGDGGTLAIQGTGYVVYDINGKETERASGPGGEVTHINNLFETIRGNHSQLNAEIGDGQISTMLCHYGNIAYRTQSMVVCDSATGEIENPSYLGNLWKREYRSGWEPQV